MTDTDTVLLCIVPGCTEPTETDDWELCPHHLARYHQWHTATPVTEGDDE